MMTDLISEDAIGNESKIENRNSRCVYLDALLPHYLDERVLLSSGKLEDEVKNSCIDNNKMIMRKNKRLRRSYFDQIDSFDERNEYVGFDKRVEEAIHKMHFAPFLSDAHYYYGLREEQDVKIDDESTRLLRNEVEKTYALCHTGIMKSYQPFYKRHYSQSMLLGNNNQDIERQKNSERSIRVENVDSNDFSSERYEQLYEIETRFKTIEELLLQHDSNTKFQSTNNDIKSMPSLAEQKLNLAAMQTAHQLTSRIDEWLIVYCKNRQDYFQRVQTFKQAFKRKAQKSPTESYKEDVVLKSSFFPSENLCTTFGISSSFLQCEFCCASSKKKVGLNMSSKSWSLSEQDYMIECLECGTIGCKKHMMLHFLSSGHNFGVTCGKEGKIYCFRSGDFVYHEIFDMENLRLKMFQQNIIHYCWKRGSIRRHSEVAPFINKTSDDVGPIWPGFRATYTTANTSPILTKCAKAILFRSQLFRGQLEDSICWRSLSTQMSLKQFELGNDYWKINAPIGLYNLGNTCYISCILQCLFHCVPFQKFFLQEIGHDHIACKTMRESLSENFNSNSKPPSSDKDLFVSRADDVCMVCEMDKLFLQVFGSSRGINVFEVLDDSFQSSQMCCTRINNINAEKMNKHGNWLQKGIPIMPNNFLACAWKSVGMTQLAGYQQSDAHEFLFAFLDTIRKNTRVHRKLAFDLGATVSQDYTEKQKNKVTAEDEKQAIEENDIVKQVFEGTLRSVLFCEKCGHKRSQPEPFVILSIPISKQANLAKDHMLHPSDNYLNKNSNTSATTKSAVTRRGTLKKAKSSTIQQCITQFCMPERLSDPVDCPKCRMKTPTQKQHSFSRLPRVLCLHLKRFNGNTNEKISDPVEFPINNLDMGSHLPHWCEISSGTESESVEHSTNHNTASNPTVLYDLFGTVDHTGSLHQGHYISNVQVDTQWYRCNDAHVTRTTEKDVSESCSSAYMLFYVRNIKIIICKKLFEATVQ